MLIVLVLQKVGRTRIGISEQKTLMNSDMSPEAKDAHFAQAFPTRSEIENYLSDATLLKSHPPILNSATYFDKRRNFWEWEGDLIIKGNWYIEPILLKITRYDQSRLTIVYSLCKELADGSLTEYNCFLVESRERIFPMVSGPLEYKDGDVFGLARLKKPPFAMPHTEITVGSLQAELHR